MDHRAIAKSRRAPTHGREPAGVTEVPSRVDDAAQRFARLAVELHQSDGVEETVQAVVDFALQALDCSHAGVALSLRRGVFEIPAVTDAEIAGLFQWLANGGNGPVLESMREHSIVRVTDAYTDGRWPEWADRVRAMGVRSALALPLTTGVTEVGVLGLYWTKRDAFGDDDEAIAQILARHASVAVAAANRQQNLAQAVDARKLVGQAMGILMERFDVDSDQAFAILKRYSQDTNAKLRDVAQQLIETRKLPH